MKTSVPTEAKRLKLNAAFEAMDDEARHLLVEIAIQYAADWPNARPRPILRVVGSSERRACNHA